MSKASFKNYPPEDKQLRLEGASEPTPGAADDAATDSDEVDFFAAFDLGGNDESEPPNQMQSLYIASLREGGVIWGFGESEDETRKAASDKWARVEPSNPQPVFIISAASPILVKAVETEGNDCPWKYDRGVAVRDEDPKPAKDAEKASALSATQETATDVEKPEQSASASGSVTSAEQTSTTPATGITSSSRQKQTETESTENTAKAKAETPAPTSEPSDPKSPADAETATDPTGGASAEPIATNIGLVDPETGELIEPTFIFKKFGWTEMPSLGKNPTKEEVDKFEAQLDQVVDRMMTNQDQAARRRAATELKCKPYDDAARFWYEQYIVPMGKLLGPHRLEKDKKGNYKGKTVVLGSGCIKFTQTGGYSVHDKNLVIAHILANGGVEKFPEIGAKTEVTYSYPKLVAALNKGTFKDWPGTVKRDKDPFAKVTVVRPGAPVTEETDD